MLPPGKLEWFYLQSKRHVLPRRSVWRDDAVPLNGAAAPCALRAVCKCCFKGSKAWLFFEKIKPGLNIYSNNKVFTAHGCSLKSCAPMEMDRRGLRAGHGCKRGRLVSAAIFSSWSSWQWWHSIPDVPVTFFLPHVFGRRLGMCSADCVRKVDRLQIFISGDH